MGGALLMRAGPDQATAQERLQAEKDAAYKLGLTDVREGTVFPITKDTKTLLDCQPTLADLRHDYPKEEGADESLLWIAAVWVHS